MHRTTLITIAAVATLTASACSSASDSTTSDPSATAPTNPGANPTSPSQTTGGGSLGGRRPFPNDNPWNTDISNAPVDPNSATLIASCGQRNLHQDFGTVWDGAPNG